jgi:hypothetical protein
MGNTHYGEIAVAHILTYYAGRRGQHPGAPLPH